MASAPSNPPPTHSTTTSTDPSADTKSETSSLSGLSDISDSDPALATLQSARAAELRALTSPSAPSTTTNSPFSTLQPYTSEKSAMHAIAAHPRSVLLFSHPSFPVCKLMAAHLSRVAAGSAYLAASGNTTSNPLTSNANTSTTSTVGKGEGEHENVLFIELEAEKAPFLTQRLKIRVLPVVVGYVGGEETGRLVGFEGLGRRGRKEGGWRRVAVVLRSWGVLGRERLVGEESDGESEDEEEGGEDAEGEGVEEIEKGSWIGKGPRSNMMAATKGVGRGEDEDEDDWD